ncbi:ABC transporter ATP-binding protein [Caldisericum exile]|uniref:ABC transporter n=1 Tax=Caldisericum exile (strain DSM 21853 / NBRC 104410 / AZM16c01) TaxID=511051 RepID=A0A7U6GE00_CALEA|nr:ABC transporter ATP-binding protein [Caldisericum exile]BAL80655.1 putative ABC transporter [Caldisericum exile AZM16c01]
MNGKKTETQQARIGPMIMGGGPHGLRSAVEKPRDFWGTFKRLMGYLKPQLGKLTLIIFLAIASTVFTVFGPRISGNAINEITNGFIAQNLVAGVSKAQEQTLPQVKTMLDTLNKAKTQAEKVAEAQVLKQFEGKQVPQSVIEEAVSKAKEKADKEVLTQFLSKASLTEDQFKALESFVNYPFVNTINDYSERAKIVEDIINLSKNLPLDKLSSFMGNTAGNTPQMRNFKFSETDLTNALDIIKKNGGRIPFDSLGQILLLLVGLYVLSSFLTFLVQYIMSDVAQKTTYSLRKDLFEKLMRLPIRYYDSHSTGDILSRMSNDLDTISTTLQQSITQIIISITQLIGYLIMMLTISGKLTIIAVLSLPVYALTMSLIIRFSQNFFRQQQIHLGRLLGHAEEMYTGHVVVKTYNREKDSIEKFEKINKDLYAANWKAQFLTGIMMPMTNFISNIAYVFIAVFGGIYVAHNVLNLGDITAFIQYSRSFSQPIIQIANISNVLQSTMACAERVFNVMDEEEELPDPKDTVFITNPRGEIVFDNVDFSYVEEKPLFEDLNLVAKPGEMVAIVGPTGAGKTTLVNLLMRFYEIKDGVIWFDGVDTRKIKRGDLRTKIGMVLQDTWLFNGTIKENIAYGKDNATDEEIFKAAKLAHADRFIRSLPQGYDTVINEEASNISAGEKQLLTIARAFLVNPIVLILDEATSNVDTRTEKLIQKAMEKLMQGRTSFVIAHRLSTIRDAKTILVMNNGKIIEQGTHEELLKKKGFYAELYYAQFVGAFDSDVVPNPEALRTEEGVS